MNCPICDYPLILVRCGTCYGVGEIRSESVLEDEDMTSFIDCPDCGGAGEFTRCPNESQHPTIPVEKAA